MSMQIVNLYSAAHNHEASLLRRISSVTRK